MNHDRGIAAGLGCSCALRSSGHVDCWGSNIAGQIGDGTIGGARTTPVLVEGLSDAIEVAAGHSHFCARRATNEVVCWGSNNLGQLGDGSARNDRLVTVRVLGL